MDTDIEMAVLCSFEGLPLGRYLCSTKVVVPFFGNSNMMVTVVDSAVGVVL